jgi:pantothenate kinase
VTSLHSLDDLVATIVAAARPATPHHPGQRIIVGIVGPPGAGKSTVAGALVERLNGVGDIHHAADADPDKAEGPAALLPMDGYHLPQARLVELGRRDRMGAPDTFDVEGFLATLTALRTAEPGTVLAPGFDRTIEEPEPGAITIGPERSIVVVEGNYLLLDTDGWGAAQRLLDVSVFAELDRDVRLTRLIDRHVRFGKTPEAARDWALGPDEANARVINATAARADHVLAL